jgi:spoIIIJ-associated protein
MRSIETEGDSIDDAISSALQVLQVDRARVEIDILSDATPGLFRLGRKKARVRATLRAALWDSPHTLDAVEPVVSRETRGIVAHQASPEAFEARCTSLLHDLLAHFGASCSVTARPGPDPGTLALEASGDSSGLLIGRRGQTLDAIEYMLNRMVNRGEEADGGRVTVDVEGYRVRRIDYLTTLARRQADKVKHSGRVVALNPMGPRDRRIVHLALKDDPAVDTRSQGQGYCRQLLIIPTVRATRRPRTESPAR